MSSGLRKGVCERVFGIQGVSWCFAKERLEFLIVGCRAPGDQGSRAAARLGLHPNRRGPPGLPIQFGRTRGLDGVVRLD